MWLKKTELTIFEKIGRISMNNKLQINISKQLLSIGMNVRHKGYYYFRIGILIVIEQTRNGTMSTQPAQKLYDQIANNVKSSYKCVARAMNYALRWAYKHGNKKEWDLIFGDQKLPVSPLMATMMLAHNIYTDTQTDHKYVS